MRWQTYVWQLGKITDVVTSATPQFFKKFNYRMIWSDGSKGPTRARRSSPSKTMVMVHMHAMTHGSYSRLTSGHEWAAHLLLIPSAVAAASAAYQPTSASYHPTHLHL